jgi:hypothetical protein
MTLAAKNGTAKLWLERNLIVLATVIADDIETLWSVVAKRGFFRTALGTPLRRHHVALVKNLLFLFGEKKNILALNTRNLNIRHCIISLSSLFMRGDVTKFITNRIINCNN